MFTIRDVGTRTIYLSAHVNAHYTFSDFVAATCSPCHDDRNEPIYASPILRGEEHSALYRELLQIALLGTIAAIATGS